MTDHALISSCAVHTGTFRGTETGYVAMEAMRVTARLLGGVGQQDRLGRVIGDAGGLEILDLRVHAVALADAVKPRAAVEGVGGGARLPQVDPARPAVLGVDELLADQAGHGAEPWRDLAEMSGAVLQADVGRQTVLHDRGDHPVASCWVHSAASRSAVVRWPSEPSAAARAAAMA